MVSYDFYANSYLGSAIPEQEFSGMAARAQGALERLKRIYRVESTGTEAENMALCAMAETLYAEGSRDGGISSATVGNVSVHYETEKHGHRTLMGRLYEQASIYLDIYRGVGT